jgi:hypothetical protein
MKKMARRFRLQFSLKSLVALMVACALALSVLVCYRQRVERQRRVVAAICEAGGAVVYDRDWPAVDTPQPPRFPRASEWLGRDWFDTVWGVYIDGEAAKIAPHLRDLGHLRSIHIYDATCGDAELAYVAELRDLESVDICGGPGVADDGIARLASLPNLKSLMLGVELGGEHVSADCLFAFAGHTKLEELYPDIPGIRGRHLAVLRSLPSLRVLDLCGDTVRDEDLAFLEGCAQLRVLRMESPFVTDAGLMHLAKLPRLEDLRLSLEARITRRGYERFHETVPDCVLFDFWYYEGEDHWESKETPGEEEVECDPAEGEREE